MEYILVMKVCSPPPLTYLTVVTVLSALDPTVHGVSLDRINLNKAKEAVTHGGLGVITAGMYIMEI